MGIRIEHVSRALRYASRSLARSPAFTLTAVATLGLGLGGTTAVFSVVNAVYLSVLPFPDSNRLFVVSVASADPGCGASCNRGMTVEEAREWGPRLEAAEGLAQIVTGGGGMVAAPTGTLWPSVARVSGNFFSVLGVRPAFGRVIVPGDAAPGAERVVVLSHSFWREHFGGDSAAVGRSLMIDTLAFRIVGVISEHVSIGRPLFSDTVTAGLFVPLESRGVVTPNAIVRLEPHAYLARLRAQLEAMVNAAPLPLHFLPARDGTRPRFVATVRGLRETYAASFRFSYPLFLASTLVAVLIACANLAGLLVARLGARSRELALRAALGAGRRRLVIECLSEGFLITAAAGTLGLLAGWWGTRLSNLLPPGALPYWAPATIDWRVAAFAIVLTATCCVASALGPALIMTRRFPAAMLRAETRGITGARASTVAKRVLVASQIAVTLVLVTGAGLLGKTFRDAATRDLGWIPSNGIWVTVVRRPGLGLWEASEGAVLVGNLLANLRRMPGVEAAAVGASGGPRLWDAGMTVEGAPEPTPPGVAPSGGNAITSGFARASGISLVRGRDFRETDDAASPPVMIVDDSTASRLFPGRLAVGGRAKFGSPTSPYPWITVVGIIRTQRCSPTAITCTYVPTMYRPLAQVAIPRGWFVIHVRTTGAPRAYLAAVRHAVDAADPTLAVSSIETADSGVRATLLPLRVNAVILSAFALFSLFLAALGVYGTFATLANERTLEIGILMALGATAASVRWRMLRSALGMTLAGVGAGAGIAWASTRVLRAILYTTSPTDPAVFLWSSIVLLASSLIAAYLPSRRASRVDPAVALRTA